MAWDQALAKHVKVSRTETFVPFYRIDSTNRHNWTAKIGEIEARQWFIKLDLRAKRFGETLLARLR